MKMNNKGFTLVEVIVVAVIVAVLAAVAIPLYNGYINDSRLNVAENIGGSVASACGATVQQNLVVPEGTHTGPTAIAFPSVTGETNNIQVPDDFEVIITATTAQCTYDPGGKNLQSTLFAFTE